MPTLTLQIAAGNDDGHYQGGACYRTSASVWFGGTSMYKGTFRFDNVPLSAAHRILTCRLYMKAASSLTPCSMNLVRLGFEDADDAGDLVANCDASSRTMTTAHTDWSQDFNVIGNQWYYSADFAASLTEVLARVGWASGNALAALAVPQAAAGTHFPAIAYESAAASAAKLVISYVSLAGGAML